MLRFEVNEDGVGHIVVDRPDAANALTPAMRDDLVAAVRNCRDDDRVRAVLVRSEGDTFCSGMDLRDSTVSKAGSAGFDPRTTSEALRVGVQTFVRELWELDKPTVAAVQGPAVGPGAHLALCMRLRLRMRCHQVPLELRPLGPGHRRGRRDLLPRLVGLPRAKQLVLLGEGIDGAGAVEEGLAYRHVADGTAMEAEAEALAVRLAAGPTRP